MTEASGNPGDGLSGAGALLRAARQKQGLHIAALAASIKVAPSKLEALESGRYDELPDATFTRALAQSVCRVLKIDAQPVLSQLPTAPGATLEKVDAGLNTPFRERPGRIDPTEWALWHQPAFWLVLLLLAGAAAFVLVPGQWSQRWLPTIPASPEREAVTPVTPAASAAESTAAVSTVVTVVPNDASRPPASAPAEVASAAPAVPPSAPVPMSAAAVVAASAQAARLRAVESTWVQATDARGQTLVSRVLQAGENLDLEGARPMRLRIGNVRGTELLDRGQRVDLLAKAQNNVATVELP